MLRKIVTKAIAIACSGAAVVAVVAVQPAHAEHVVTDYEAGKLTLAALTAAPARVVHHASHHHSARGLKKHGARVILASHHGRSARSLVHTVAYHTHGSVHKTAKRRHHT